MNIGRRIYYDTTTGECIQDTGERSDVVVTRTVEQDMETFKALSERNRETFDLLELPFGEFEKSFAGCTSFKVDVEKKELVFSFSSSTEPPFYEKSLKHQLEQANKEISRLGQHLAMNNDNFESLTDVLLELGVI